MTKQAAARMTRFSPRRSLLPRAVANKVRLRQLPDIDDCQVFVVDGELLRNRVDVDFALGGNGARYRYIPLDELWVEDLGSFPDMWFVAHHEARERGHMLAGLDYDHAHDLASGVERKERRRGTKKNPDSHSTREETVEQIVSHGHYGFWLSPTGECYVVSGSWEHEEVSIQLARQLGLDEFSSELALETRGWARAAGLPIRFDLQFGIDTERGDWYEPSQRQIDTLFDLQLALPPGKAQDMVRTLIERMLHNVDSERNPIEAVRTVCCSCETVIVDAPPGPHGEISHGYCPKCVKATAAEYGLSPQVLLHILEQPTSQTKTSN